jgi:hypothetical protein
MSQRRAKHAAERQRRKACEPNRPYAQGSQSGASGVSYRKWPQRRVSLYPRWVILRSHTEPQRD